MLKFLSKVVVEYCPLDPRKAAAVELLAQCNGRKAKDSNPACSVELRRLPAPPPTEDPKSRPPLPPPRVLVTYLNGAEEAIVAAEGATAQGIRTRSSPGAGSSTPSRCSATPGRSGPSSSPRRSSGCRSLASRCGLSFILCFHFHFVEQPACVGACCCTELNVLYQWDYW